MAPAVAHEDTEAEGRVVPAVGILEARGEAGLRPAVVWEPELKQIGVTPVRGDGPWDLPGPRSAGDPPRQKAPDTAAAETSL